MTNKHPSIYMIENVATGLKHLKDKVVFVGGAVVPLYIDDPGAPELRPTEDVDCIFELTSKKNYHELEEKLRSLGFKNDISDGAPICRWNYQGTIVDIMPTDQSIIGFANKWYHEGMRNTQEAKLIKNSVTILTLPFFLASKIEAFLDRGNGDFLASADIEDIIAILDGSSHVEAAMLSAPKKVKNYLKSHLKAFVLNSNFTESLEGHMQAGAQSRQRINRLLTLIHEVFII